MVSNKYLTTTVDNIVNTDLYTLVPTFAKYKSVCRYKERKIEKNTKIYKIRKKWEHGRVVLQKNF